MQSAVISAEFSELVTLNPWLDVANSLVAVQFFFILSIYT